MKVIIGIQKIVYDMIVSIKVKIGIEKIVIYDVELSNITRKIIVGFKVLTLH